MTAKHENNYAFIDGNNLYLTMENLGWKLDYGRFRVYLKEKYGVEKAYYFIGFIRANEKLYSHLMKKGYTLVFKEVLQIKNIETGDIVIKGNVDAELVLQSMIDYDTYKQAVIISSDGDYACLVRYLASKDKLLTVLAPCEAGCSHLLVKTSQGKIAYVDKLKEKLSLGKKNEKNH